MEIVHPRNSQSISTNVERERERGDGGWGSGGWGGGREGRGEERERDLEVGREGDRDLKFLVEILVKRAVSSDDKTYQCQQINLLAQHHCMQGLRR